MILRMEQNIESRVEEFLIEDRKRVMLQLRQDLPQAQ